MEGTHILVFLKAPRLHFVKTRLAESVGAKTALSTYRCLVARQLEAIPKEAKTEIVFTPADAEAEMRTWLGPDYHYRVQAEGDLSDRLTAATEAAFSEGAEKIICIGGDCPGLDARILREADRLLQSESDVAFGPTEDGGYYLVGLRAPHLRIFEGIPWSSPDTLFVSMERAQELGLQIRKLETLYDVDDEDTLKRAVSEGLIAIK